MSQDQILNLVYIALPFLFTGIVVPAAMWLVSKLPANQQAEATTYIQHAVNAVEQVASNSTANMSSTDKKNLAVQFATVLLQGAHLNIETTIVSQLIESAVYVLNSQKTTTVQSTVTTVAAAPPVQAATSVATPAVTATGYDVSAVSSQTANMPVVK